MSVTVRIRLLIRIAPSDNVTSTCRFGYLETLVVGRSNSIACSKGFSQPQSSRRLYMAHRMSFEPVAGPAVESDRVRQGKRGMLHDIYSTYLRMTQSVQQRR